MEAATQMSDTIQRILFIDDDPEHLSVVQCIVETHMPGVVVDVVTTSAGAEQRLNERCYDLVVSDQSLHGELGTRICQRLLEQDPDQPVLLLTNYNQHDKIMDDARALNLPVYAKWEIDEPEFLTLLHAQLSRRPCPDDSAGRVAPLDLSEGNSEPNSDASTGISRAEEDAAAPSRVDRRSNRPPRPIRLTSPLVKAARTTRAA